VSEVKNVKRKLNNTLLPRLLTIAGMSDLYTPPRYGSKPGSEIWSGIKGMMENEFFL